MIFKKVRAVQRANSKHAPKWLCFLFLPAFMLGSIHADLNAQDLQDYNKAYIWRGMQHEWTYNHRINRLGNYVTSEEGGQAVHTSATGLGSDSTFFTTHYTYIEAPDVVFKEIPITIQVNGKEGELLTKTEEIYIKAEPWLRDKDFYYALINGFEIQSISKADQLQLFRFLIKDVSFSKESDEIKVTADFNLVTNCRTIECPIIDNKTAYKLTLRVLVFAFDDGDANYATGYTSRNYVWDETIEVEDRSLQTIITGQRDKFPHATVGIKGLGIILDAEHWLLEIGNYIVPNTYDPELGVLTSDAILKYVEWKKGMQQFAVSPFKAKFAKRRKGYALLDMNIAMIQLKNAKIEQEKSSGRLFWKGWNMDADSEEAEHKISIHKKLK